ncbi:biopolymer transporter ExbD [candidate division KSB1 bacterium]|nr:biopolymer transporter ExbD [candidate division KSB1 bacterium]RQW02673.1 MAG: biopolymer transporter ExbD [candidate division KSB1 bacterium]
MKIEEQTTTLKLAKGSTRMRRGTFALRLTSMIDMFTILLVFLLKSYSADGQIMTVAQDLRLPESTSEKKPEVMSVVAVTKEWLLVDGRPIERLETIVASEMMLIAPLFEELQRLRSISEGIGELSSQMQGFRGNIAIQGDKDITFDLLKRIMLTCGKVGYNNMHLAVLEKE